MQSITTYLCSALILATGFSSASGHAGEKASGPRHDNKSISLPSDRDAEKNDASKPEVLEDKPSIWIHLIGGRRMEVDEVTETTEGLWYTQGNVSTFLDRTRVTKIERPEDRKAASAQNSFLASGRWSISESAKVENFFMSQFKRPLPLTAFGQSELHTRWGLDHRNGMDVGLHPDSVEGKALIKFLLSEEIPFLTFRKSVPGVATGPHIHVGNGSHRLGGRQSTQP